MKFKEIQEACWTGYRQAGMKNKGGRQVPNCVPVEEVKTGPEMTLNDLLYTAAAKAMHQAGLEGQPMDYEEAIKKAAKIYRIPYTPSELPRLLAQRAEIDRQLALLKQGKQVAKARRQAKLAPTPAGAEEYWRTHALPTDRIKPPAKTLEETEAELAEDLKKWFKEKWVRFGPDGKIRGACARGSKSEGKPKCLPQSKAHALGKKGRASAAAKKRREDPNPERRGPARNVATKVREQGVAESSVDNNAKLSWVAKKLASETGIPGDRKDFLKAAKRFDRGYTTGGMDIIYDMDTDPRDDFFNYCDHYGAVYEQGVAEGFEYASRVQHPKYGAGQIIKVYSNGVITVNFPNYPDPIDKKPGVQSNFAPGDSGYQSLKSIAKEQYNDDDWYDDADEFGMPGSEFFSDNDRLRDGDYVRDRQDGKYGEIFRMSGDPSERRVRILDRDGKGWYISPERLVAVDRTDPDIMKYFGRRRQRDMDEATSPAQQAAIAIAMKKTGKKPKTTEGQLDEKCWPGYKKKGMKTMFGKRYPNCVKKESIDEALAALDSDAVRRIQHMLNVKFDANLDVDGAMGPITVATVKKFLPAIKKSGAPDPDRNTAVQGKEEKLDEGVIDAFKNWRQHLAMIIGGPKKIDLATVQLMAMQELDKVVADGSESSRLLKPFIDSLKDAIRKSQSRAEVGQIASRMGKELPQVVDQIQLKRLYDRNPEAYHHEMIRRQNADKDQLKEKQDACYRKVKSRYKVWPSAYASGALVQCRKKGAANWGNKSKK